MTTPAAGGGLEAKHYILAAFTAGFIAVAVVTIVFVVLSPAHISFSVTSAGSHDISDGGLQLDLTIAADNPSRRAAVLYRSIFVDVSINTGTGTESLANSARADVATGMPLRQPVGNVTEIHASVTSLSFPEEFTRNKTSHRFMVRVTAVARFKIGVAWTRVYDIKVSCVPVDFFANKRSTAGCHAAAF